MSIASPHDRRSWSGIPHYALRQLREVFRDIHSIETPWLDRVVRLAAGLERHGLLIRRHPFIVGLYSRRINAKLKRLQPDVVVGVAAAHKLAGIDRKWPLVYTADGLFASISSYYGKYLKLSRRSRDLGNRIQAALLQRADRILLASEWAVRDACRSYAIEPDSIGVAPMGANLDHDPGFQAVEADQPLRLLFVGLDWERKGGQRVFEVWQALRRHHAGAELDIVGVRPPTLAGIEGVRLHGRIDKSDARAFENLRALYAKSSFLILLSKQEAYGLVCCEAAAFGRPTVASRTGGIETIVRDDQTGILVDEDESVDEIALRILATWSNPAAYRSMCEGARRRYETTLNWASWASHVRAAVDEALADRDPKHSHSATFAPLEN